MQSPAPASTGARRAEPIAPPGLGELLAHIDSLAAGGTGMVSFERGSDAEGVVLVESGRICWAAAARMKRRLTDLLVAGSGGRLDRRVLSEVFARCREDGRPFGEVLVANGYVASEVLHDALLAHTIDALRCLASGRDLVLRWTARSTPSYDARFTFAPAELAGAANDSVASEAAAELERWLGGVGSGLVFDRAGAARPRMLTSLRAEELPAEAIRELAVWAAQALDLAGAFASAPRFVLAVTANGSTWMGWMHGGLVHVALCERSADAAAVLGRLARGL